jgi:hypothetical protein
VTQFPLVSDLVPQPWSGDAESLLDNLVADVASGIRVLRHRDGVLLSEDQVMDRARNVVAGLIGGYSIERRRP